MKDEVKKRLRNCKFEGEFGMYKERVNEAEQVRVPDFIYLVSFYYKTQALSITTLTYAILTTKIASAGFVSGNSGEYVSPRQASCQVKSNKR